MELIPSALAANIAPAGGMTLQETLPRGDADRLLALLCAAALAACGTWASVVDESAACAGAPTPSSIAAVAEAEAPDGLGGQGGVGIPAGNAEGDLCAAPGDGALLVGVGTVVGFGGERVPPRGVNAPARLGAPLPPIWLPGGVNALARFGAPAERPGLRDGAPNREAAAGGDTCAGGGTVAVLWPLRTPSSGLASCSPRTSPAMVGVAAPSTIPVAARRGDTALPADGAVREGCARLALGRPGAVVA